jgi:chloramphenicol O-acetyltransferase type A
VTRYIDLERWSRFQHYQFFKDYELPFFSLCTSLDATALLATTRAKGYSFFITYHYLSLKAANEVEEFRYRLRNDGVIVHDRVDTGTTMLRPDNTFSLAYFDFDDDFTTFRKNAEEEVARRRSGEVELLGRIDRDDMIYHSVIPWTSFTGLTHARVNRSESVPKVVFGRYREEGGRMMLPISVEGHHAVMDAFHMGRFLGLLETWFADPESGGVE